MSGVNKLEAATATPPHSSFSMPASMPRPSESQSPIPSPGLQSSRPTTPSPLTSSINIHFPLVSRRPSSSLSIRSASSRRTSMLPPTDPSLPQRLPRQPSQQDMAAFTELHQELEIEQEAQVNRLLNIIRLQQQQCQQPYSVTDDNSSTAATIDSNSATAGRARSPASASPLSRRGSGRLSRQHSSSRRSHSLASTTSYPGGNIILDNSSDTSSGAPGPGPTQPDIAYCVAEARAIMKQAHMLGMRMRELERQVAELSPKPAAVGSDASSSIS